MRSQFFGGILFLLLGNLLGIDVLPRYKDIRAQNDMHNHNC